MNQEYLNKLLKNGPQLVEQEFAHSPEFEKEMENEPWDEYEKEDFQ